MNIDLFTIQAFSLLKNSFIFGLSGLLIAIICCPLSFLRTQKQQTGGNSYIKIFSINTKKYGYSVLYSGFSHYSLLLVISTLSFSVIESFSIPLIKLFLDPYTFTGILLRVFILGLIETIMIIYFDYHALKKQKIGLLEYNSTNLKIFFVLYFLKNTIMWFGIMIPIYFSYKYQINLFEKTIISFFIGGSFGFSTLPLDIMAVKIIGLDPKKSVWKIFKQEIEIKGIKRVFSGGLMKFIILSIYTIIVVLTDVLLKS
jgi:hypothetical protein